MIKITTISQVYGSNLPVKDAGDTEKSEVSTFSNRHYFVLAVNLISITFYTFYTLIGNEKDLMSYVQKWQEGGRFRFQLFLTPLSSSLRVFKIFCIIMVKKVQDMNNNLIFVCIEKIGPKEREKKSLKCNADIMTEV